jgi:hypothetical protein
MTVLKKGDTQFFWRLLGRGRWEDVLFGGLRGEEHGIL